MSSGLGASNTPTADIDYSTYLADLEANPHKSANDATALANMPAGPNTGINNATQVDLTAANLAAIGETADANELVSEEGGFDGTLYFNFSITNDSRPDADPNKYDLQSVVAHEIDEVLGIGGNGSTLYQPGDTPPDSLPPDVGPLDFFRYSAPGVESFTYDPTTSAYFSINGGTTNLVYFNQQNGADGADFGDWGNPQGTGEGNTPPQVQDAFGSPDATPNLGVNELTALDVVGWNLISTNTGGTAPTITGVSVDSTAWSSKFPYASGYPIPTGSSQLTDLPWINLNQVNITFNEAVNVAQGDLTVDGVNTPSYTISNFSYNATTFTATWTFGSSIGADKLLLDLSGTGTNAVTSTAGSVPLDGTWTNGTSTFPSGNNAPGTDFKFDLNVLPGDVKQTGGPVTILDVIQTRNAQLTSAGGTGYSAFDDVDGGGSVNILDVVDVRNRQLTSLPSGTPAIATAAAQVAPAAVSIVDRPANSITDPSTWLNPSLDKRIAALRADVDI
jgi:hypothetical protein